MPSPLYRQHVTLGKQLPIHAFFALHTQAPVEEKCWTRVGPELLLESYNLVYVGDDCVKVDAPLNELALACLVVYEVARNEVSNTRVFEALLDEVHRCLSRLALNIESLDLLYAFKCPSDNLLIAFQTFRSSVNADEAVHTVWMQTGKSHGRFRPEVVPQDGELLQAFLVGKT